MNNNNKIMNDHIIFWTFKTIYILSFYMNIDYLLISIFLNFYLFKNTVFSVINYIFEFKNTFINYNIIII